MSSTNEDSSEQAIPGAPVIAAKDYNHLQPHIVGNWVWLIAHLGPHSLEEDGCSGIARRGGLRGLRFARVSNA